MSDGKHTPGPFAAAPDLLAELKRLEWSIYSEEQGRVCPTCFGARDIDGHSKVCTLAAALRKAEGR